MQTESGSIGPFVNANPRLTVGQRFDMGLNVEGGAPVTIELESSDPAIVSVPPEITTIEDSGVVMFEITAHKLGRVTITTTFNETKATTTASVERTRTDIASLVGATLNYVGSYVYELDSEGASIAVNTNGPVVKDMIVKTTSDTPEVASVPESVVIPVNDAGSIPLQLRAAGTSIITASCEGVTLTTVIEVIPPQLRIASIVPNSVHVKAGDEVDVAITMTDNAISDIAITLQQHDQLESPTALVIPRGRNSGSRWESAGATTFTAFECSRRRRRSRRSLLTLLQPNRASQTV